MGAIIIKQKLPKNNRPWWHISRRLPRNPFDPQYIIQHLEWCRVCKMDVDVDIEAANAGGLDVYRKCCRRCGNVVQHGIGQREVSGDTFKQLPRQAMEFIQKKGKDRR